MLSEPPHEISTPMKTFEPLVATVQVKVLAPAGHVPVPPKEIPPGTAVGAADPIEGTPCAVITDAPHSRANDARRVNMRYLVTVQLIVTAPGVTLLLDQLHWSRLMLPEVG